MEFQSRFENQIAVITIAGRLDGVTALECEKSMRELVIGDTNRIIIDFGNLDYISSAGLRSILLTAKLVNEKRGQLCLANVTGNVRSVFDMSGFSSMFKIADSVEQALASFA
jgi:stage II sporulation protein AA (anti-sigma F factor antagonist)